MNTELHYVANKIPNIYGVMNWGKPDKRLNYNAHTNTVPAGNDWLTNSFKPIIKDGKLYDRGVCARID